MPGMELMRDTFQFLVSRFGFTITKEGESTLGCYMIFQRNGVRVNVDYDGAAFEAWFDLFAEDNHYELTMIEIQSYCGDHSFRASSRDARNDATTLAAKIVEYARPALEGDVAFYRRLTCAREGI